MGDILEESYEIRWAEKEDWQTTMDLVWKTFMEFEAADYTEEGITNFHDFISNGKIYHMFENGTYPMLVACRPDRIIGQISVRNRNHISLLFVDKAYHRKGVGRALMNRMGEFLKNECGEAFMSVMAAPYAIGFYRKCGFHVCGPEKEYAGIRVMPMEKFL